LHGPPPARASYLNISAILSAAAITSADAIHPGVGSPRTPISPPRRGAQLRLYQPPDISG
jgi:biotin carboxylase